MAEVVTIGWNEDIDLNAGAAAIAALKGQDHLRTLSGTDAIVINNPGGVILNKIMAADEASTVTIGGGYVARNDKSRKYRFGKMLGSPSEYTLSSNGGLGDVLPKDVQLDCLGNGSGSGAEQHSVLIDVIRPDIAPVPKAAWGSWTREVVLGVKTGTLTADTVSGYTAILTNFEDSEQSFGTDPGRKYALISITPSPGGAGYGVAGVCHANRIVHRLFPAYFTLISRQAKEYFLTDTTGKATPWLFSGNESPLLVGAGVGTTSTEFTVRLGLYED